MDEIVTIHIPHGISSTEYPLGVYIQNNKEKIKQLINCFMGIPEFKECGINLVCRGSSGAIIASMFSMMIPNNHRIVHVKKDGESSHNDCCKINKDWKIVIVDDFISLGYMIH